MRNGYTKIYSYGPGGYKCHCCGPKPSDRKRERRRVKKLERIIVWQNELGS